jgi:hypothetical protein
MVYLNHAFELRQQRRSSSFSSYRHWDAKQLAGKAIRYDRNLAAAYILIGDIEYDNQRLAQAKVAWNKAKSLDTSQPGIEQSAIIRYTNIRLFKGLEADVVFVLGLDAAADVAHCVLSFVRVQRPQERMNCILHRSFPSRRRPCLPASGPSSSTLTFVISVTTQFDRLWMTHA